MRLNSKMTHKAAERVGGFCVWILVIDNCGKKTVEMIRGKNKD